MVCLVPMRRIRRARMRKARSRGGLSRAVAVRSCCRDVVLEEIDAHAYLVPTFMKQGRLRWDSRKLANLASKASHAGIIRIGFEGIFSAPHRGAPLFQYTQLKHPGWTECKSSGRGMATREGHSALSGIGARGCATAGDVARQRVSIQARNRHAAMLMPASMMKLPATPCQS